MRNRCDRWDVCGTSTMRRLLLAAASAAAVAAQATEVALQEGVPVSGSVAGNGTITYKVRNFDLPRCRLATALTACVHTRASQWRWRSLSG